jgi:hypothetical protein
VAQTSLSSSRCVLQPDLILSSEKQLIRTYTFSVSLRHVSAYLIGHHHEYINEKIISGGLSFTNVKYSENIKIIIQTSESSPYERPRRPRGGVEVELYSFFNLGARWRWVVNAMPRPLYTRERPCTHCIGVGWGPGPVWTGAKNLAPIGIRSLDRPARSESLYRLSYPGPINKVK